MDTRNKKRIITGLGIAAAAGAALAITAGTFASFSDAEASPNQAISAGTLDLVPGGTAVSNPINTVNAKPNDLGNTGRGKLELTNQGSLAGKLTLTVEKVADLDNGCNEPEKAAEPTCEADNLGELDDKLIVVVYDSTWTHQLGSKVLNNWPGTTINLGELAPGATETVIIDTQIMGSADNRVQSDSTSFVVKADLNQS